MPVVFIVLLQLKQFGVILLYICHVIIPSPSQFRSTKSGITYGAKQIRQKYYT